MKDELIIHIGLGKAASSTMQSSVFNIIAKKLGYFYISNKSPIKDEKNIDIKNKITKHIMKMIIGLDVNKIDFPKFSIISNEGFSSYRQPQFYEEFAEKNLKAFGEKAHIVLVIRRPSDFLNSIYVQCCVHEKPLQSPEFFFLNDKNYSERYPNNTYHLSKSNTLELINYYKSRFRKVTVLKYESIKDGKNLQKIFGFDETTRNEIAKVFNSSVVNKSLGKKAFKFMIFIDKITKVLGFTLSPKYNNKILISRLNDFNKIEKLKQQKFFYKYLQKLNRIFTNPTLIDKIFGYKKINVDFDKLEINIKKLDEEYDLIPDYEVFEK